MDYRVTAVRDSAKGLAAAAEKRVEEYRAQSLGSRDVDYVRETRIARANGEATAYHWCANELDALGDLPEAGELTGTHGKYCEPCASRIAQLPKLIATYGEYCGGYGASGSYTREAKSKVDECVKALSDAMELHKQGRA